MKYRFLVLLLGIGTFLYGNEIKPTIISCEPVLIYACTPEGCEKIDVVNLDEVQYFEVDTQKRTFIGKVGETQIDIENIFTEKREGEAYIFYGTQLHSKYDWMLRINKGGNMTLISVHEDNKSFTTYGKCKWKEKK